MLKRYLSNSLVLVVMLALGFVLSAFTPNSGEAHKRHSGKAVRKTSHSALHSSKRHSKFSAKKHRVASKPLTLAEKADIIGKIKSLANAETTEATVNPIVAENGTIEAADIAQAAKEEREEDDVQVTMDQFLKARDAEDMDPQIAKDRQTDFTLFDQADPSVSATRSDVMQQIIDWVGTRYHFGGLTRTGIDCSAFTREVFRRSFNVEIPRTASEQSVLGNRISREQLHFGDLVFFHTANHAHISHVGIYVGEGLFANASCSRGVTVSSMQSSYWSKRFLFAKRLFTNEATAQREIKAALHLASTTTTDGEQDAN